MKICIIASVFPRSPDDLEVPWFREIVRRCHERGADIQVYVPSFRGLKSHTIDGIRVNRFRYFFAPWETLTHEEGAPNKIHKLHYKFITLFYLFFGTLGLIRLHRRERFDILHVHWPFPHAIFAVAARLFAPASLILNFYGASLLLVNKYGFVKWFLAAFVRTADACVAISNYTAGKVRAVRDCDVTIIPYGATIGEPAGLVSADRDKPLILTVGRMIERKGFEFAVRAMPSILETVPGAQLCMVSDGPMRQPLQDLAEKLGVSDHVSLPGKVSPVRLQDLFATCTVFVLPSVVDSKGDTEGLGVVIMEALVCKKPVVASDVGGIVDIIKNEQTGLLVPPGESGPLAGAIVRVIENRELASRLGEQGYLHVKKTFDWDVITDQVLTLYGRMSFRNPV